MPLGFIPNGFFIAKKMKNFLIRFSGFILLMCLLLALLFSLDKTINEKEKVFNSDTLSQRDILFIYLLTTNSH